ncbi:hypothetical protein AQJ30_15720 [Streptomyces longwoodensis]|uniref:Uncharacterized protein n=1 Tax=Streptomyces longwoodensis TaxID=68231 RepID=A0A101QXU6_9ACTN|nr:hypothetical protein [Streptomyces longwoodensis]KUN37731.1 hypothetical protein AQJ30_15720 [Streptomyces longwoodensis]
MKKLGFTKPISPDDPRLRGHETTYKASQGGWVKDDGKPVAGEPQQQHDVDERSRARRWR